MSHQPAWDSQTEQGLPTHVPRCRGGIRLWSHSVLPEDIGIAGGGGGSRTAVGHHAPAPHSTSKGADKQTDGSSKPLTG